MNREIFEGQWKQVRGEMRKWWGKLTDNDVDKIAGSFDKLLGILQERYGYDKQKAEEEISRRLAKATHKSA